MKVEVRLFATFREGREKKQIMELEDNSTITVSMATWNQIVQCGLEACGYTQGQKVKCVVAGQPDDREEEKRWEQL